jgi:hypothetical protein
VKVAVVVPSRIPTANKYVAPSRRFEIASTGTAAVDEATVTPSDTVGPLSTGARSWICRLIAPPAEAISWSSSSPASMNRGWNWWAK